MWSWPHWPRLNKPVSNTELWLGQSGSLFLLGIWNQNTLHTSDWSCVEPRLTQLSCYVWSCFLQTLHGLREKERMILIFAFQFLAWVHFKICLPFQPRLHGILPCQGFYSLEPKLWGCGWPKTTPFSAKLVDEVICHLLPFSLSFSLFLLPKFTYKNKIISGKGRMWILLANVSEKFVDK